MSFYHQFARTVFSLFLGTSRGDILKLCQALQTQMSAEIAA